MKPLDLLIKRCPLTVFQFIEGDFEDYLFKLQDPQVFCNEMCHFLSVCSVCSSALRFSVFQQWVGEVEINALAVIYK